MLTLALDPSSTACGWALFRGKQLAAHGTVRRGKGGLGAQYTVIFYARVCAAKMRQVMREFSPASLEVWYEINDGAQIPRSRQRSMRLAQQATGRILQALEVEGHGKQADNRKKAVRAREMSLIYGVKDEPDNEHVLDAIALGHRVVSEIRTDEGPGRRRPGPR